MTIDVQKLREEYKEPHFLIDTVDRKKLFLKVWQSSAGSHTAILIFHGITAYHKPYGEIVAQPLANAGYHVFALDLRGHGLSDGNRGDIKNKELLIQDLHNTISFLKEKYLKLVLLGHSLGVITAILAYNSFPDDVNGLILLSAGRASREGVYKKPTFGMTMKALFSSIFTPSKPVFRYYREGVTGLDDPLRVFNYTIRFIKILSVKNVHFPLKVPIPVIVGVGDQDEIFDINSPKALLDEIPSDDKQFIIIKGAKHAEFPQESWGELVKWLDSRFK
jgi:alpha-beta hydrolase superfamily lysophospholipase